MTDEEIERERVLALCTRDALHRIRGGVLAGRAITPSDLSVWMRKSGTKAWLLFIWMASRAVAGKYQQAGRHDVAARLATEALVVQGKFPLTRLGWDDREALYDAGRRLKVLFSGRKRISQHQSRVVCVDPDIILCARGIFSRDMGITPWVCQGPDLRFRWTDDGMKRLAYLADCQDAYARCAFSWEDRFIGLRDFPVHDAWC